MSEITAGKWVQIVSAILIPIIAYSFNFSVSLSTRVDKIESLLKESSIDVKRQMEFQQILLDYKLRELTYRVNKEPSYSDLKRNNTGTFTAKYPERKI